VAAWLSGLARAARGLPGQDSDRRLNSKAVAAPVFAAMRPYGGQQLTTGALAQVYAGHFIANHLKAIGGGKTYAQLSAEAIAQPANTALAAQVATVFKGETLRGLLLNAYAFGTMATIAGIAAIAAFIAGAIMLAPERPGPGARPPHLPGHRNPLRAPGTRTRPGHLPGPRQRPAARRHPSRLTTPAGTPRQADPPPSSQTRGLAG
jgi:hypothetical protein